MHIVSFVRAAYTHTQTRTRKRKPSKFYDRKHAHTPSGIHCCLRASSLCLSVCTRTACVVYYVLCGFVDARSVAFGYSLTHSQTHTGTHEHTPTREQLAAAAAVAASPTLHSCNRTSVSQRRTSLRTGRVCHRPDLNAHTQTHTLTHQRNNMSSIRSSSSSSCSELSLDDMLSHREPGV